MANKVLDPTKVKVLISTRWSGSNYKSSTIRRVESYSIETAIDSDADPWSITVGNPTGDLNAILARDNEVRVQIYGAGDRKTYLLTGIMDDANFDQNGSVTITGRDLSSIAVDSDHFPDTFRSISARELIQREAKEIGVTSSFKLAKTGGAKTWFTDGSEKYWEFWYRMIRKEKQWMWMEPDGTLVSGELNYASSPKYRFASADIAGASEIPVEGFSFRKTTQGRIGKLAVVWRSQKSTQAGRTPNVEVFEDETTAAWRKRPQRIIEDKHAVSVKTAKKVADEEIHESKVGAIEIVINIPDPGYLIEMNNMCRVRLPQYGISGEWFIVGTAIQGDASGFTQSLRLREKNFAISSRVPDDPEWDKDVAKGGDESTGTGQWPSGCAGKKMGKHVEWWPCFVAAAEKWRGSFSLDLFLAALLAIASHETGIHNLRSHTISRYSDAKTMPTPNDHDQEWYDIRKENPTPAELEAWKEKFVNEGGSYGIPSGWAAAVGPMQLWSQYLKEEADGGKVDEFFGNRWNPCDNIMAAAHRLHDGIPYQSGKEEDLWAGVCQYGFGPSAAPDCPYGQWVKDQVKDKADGWLGCVQEALTAPPVGPAGQWVFPVQGQSADNFNDGGGPCSHVSKNGVGAGWQSNCAHDIMCSGGTPFLAVSQGTVTDVTLTAQSPGVVGGHTWAVHFTSEDGTEWWYGHVTGDPSGDPLGGKPTVSGPVAAGAILGYANNSDVHLHIGVHEESINSGNCDDPRFDPVEVLKGKMKGKP